MPSYISHAIMANEVYDKSKNDNSLFKINISADNIRTFSLGTDLAHFTKSSYATHNINTQAFFINMINYIKDNHLENDENIMALLYGHIAHYFLDINTHPLIYYIEKNARNKTKISNHTLVEGFLDNYLTDSILKINPLSIKSTFFNKGSINYKPNLKLIRETFHKTYKENRAVQSYKMVISCFTIIRNIITTCKLTKNDLCYLSGFNTFMETNNLSISDLLNSNNIEWFNLTTGEKHQESFEELYLKSITDTLTAINEVNKYIYGKLPYPLEKIFTNISYDTGVNCNLGNQILKQRKK